MKKLERFGRKHSLALLGAAAAVLVLLWIFVPRPIVKDPAQVRNIRIEYNGQTATGFDPLRAAELLCRVNARRLPVSHSSYACIMEVSFQYGRNRRPFHMALGRDSDFCYGTGPVEYYILDAPAVLEQFESLLPA